MRLTRMANVHKEPLPPPPIPTPTHEAMVEVIEDLLSLFAGSDHPLVVMVKAVKSGLIRDLAEIPAETIQNGCRDFAERFIYIANAGLEFPEIAAAADEALNERTESDLP